MNWKLKALLQLGLSGVPGGEGLNYLCQRYVTKSLPTSQTEFLCNVSFAKSHIDAIHRYYDRSLREATFYEFGAGWEITIPLAFYAFGVEHQILVDIQNLVRPTLVNNTIEKYQRIEGSLNDRLLRTPLSTNPGWIAHWSRRTPCV